jgi:hypothetical protein
MLEDLSCFRRIRLGFRVVFTLIIVSVLLVMTYE